MSSSSSLSFVDEQVLDGGEYKGSRDSSCISQDSQNDTAGESGSAGGLGGVAT